jgi:hypothetical protein
VTRTPQHLRTLGELSAPALNYPAQPHGPLRAMLQFAGTRLAPSWESTAWISTMLDVLNEPSRAGKWQ